jgi:ribonuclease HI
MRMGVRIKIYFDGGCRPNPGMMEIAVVVRGVAHVQHDIGAGTGMDAEWLALISALRIGQSLGDRDYVLLGDAAAVIEQATGRAKCRGAYVRHFDEFRALTAGASPRIRYVKRSQNLAGIALERTRLGLQFDSSMKISPS